MVKARIVRTGLAFFGVAAACTALSGCVSSPTYGTDKTAFEQLTDDLGSTVSLSSKPTDAGVKYNPRPDLVLPPKGDDSDLVKPQQSLASSNNPEWVESPEDTRKRLVAEADAHSNDPSYRSPLLEGYGKNGTMTEEQKWEAFRQARKLQQGSYIDQRRLLSDPPTAYTEIDPSKLNDLGVPEEKKEKARKKAAEVSGTGRSWWQAFE
ncbi:hypothetical protein NAC44_17345 [Allorhizobium sp. BGMRC 0089]|uniref:hypothetical protein n=1 Tax=Allorhizobium sonneratiae TaxID=2934936 RepID=UPI0020342168|nr:hypothetical protein [Allorhizobium sonneratiae]MCM2294095.1 hypothetical protein [Allorhizobium sonneratiae]